MFLSHLSQTFQPLETENKKLFIKISFFIRFSDIYIYLNNNNLQIKDEEDEARNETFIQIEKKRLELIKKCKYIRNLVENEFCGNNDDVDSSSYLEMGGVANGNCEKIELESKLINVLTVSEILGRTFASFQVLKFSKPK